MDVKQAQARIDAVEWYHEFDFGGGLRSRSCAPDVGPHRANWAFIEQQLQAVDFRGKSVLDIGAWDGWWSFFAERRGAASVLAADDRTQNWSDGAGIHLARELYRSRIDIDQDLSVYRLASLGRTFDVILFLGVYYHLHDPLQALAQIRHCCHPGTVLVVEGPEALMLPAGAALCNFAHARCEWLPTRSALEQTLHAAYLRPKTWANPGPNGRPAPLTRLGWRWRLRLAGQALRGSRPGMNAVLAQVASEERRVLAVCEPFEGVNEAYTYRPPLGLHVYDPRFRTPAGVRAAG